MKISVTGPADVANDDFRKSVVHHLDRAFGSFAGSIVGIEALLTEPPTASDGGLRHCRLTVELSGSEAVTSDAEDQNALAAVLRAAGRARQSVTAMVARPRPRPD